MIQLSRKSAAVLRFDTDLRALDVHFAGKTFVCAGPGCEYCCAERPRRRYYAMATMAQESGIVELPPTLGDKIATLALESVSGHPTGLVVELSRSGTRSAWRILRHKWNDIKEHDWADFVNQAAILFRVTIPEGLDVWSTFGQIAGAAHAPLLAKQLLFN